MKTNMFITCSLSKIISFGKQKKEDMKLIIFKKMTCKKYIFT